MEQKEEGLMKRSVKLIIASLFIILLAGIYLLIQALTSPTPSTEEEIKALFSVDKALVDRISFSTAAEELTIIKKDDGFWYLEDDKDFPLDQDVVTSMLTVISPMYSIMTVTDNCADTSIYGLDNGTRVRIGYGDKELGFTVGSTSDAVEGCYLRFPDSKAVYLADINASVAFSHKSRYSVICLDKYPSFNVDSIKDVEISSLDASLKLTKEEKRFNAHLGSWAKEESGKSYPVDEALCDELLYLVKGISFKECTDYKATKEELGEYFSESISLKVSYLYTTKDESSETITTPVSFTLMIGSPCDGEKSRYARLGDSDLICTVDKETADKITAFLQKDILDKSIFGFDEATTDSVKITVGSKVHLLEKKLSSSENSEPSTYYILNGLAIDPELSEEITLAITKARADATGSFDTSAAPEIIFEFTLTDKTVYTVSLYPANGEVYAVESDGLCYKSVSKAVIDGILKLLQQ